MSVKRWLRLRFLRKRRKLMRELRRVNRALADAQTELERARDYHPRDLGGFEDRMNWEDQALGRIRRFEGDLYSLAGRLKMSIRQASRFN